MVEVKHYIQPLWLDQIGISEDMAGNTGPQFTAGQRARVFANTLRNNFQSRTADPNFRRYGTIFIMAAAVLGALVGKEGQKQAWDNMNADNHSTWGNLTGGGGSSTPTGRNVPISDKPRNSW
jgi:hypothetical protein